VRAALRRLDRVLKTVLELAPVHESGERIVGRLIGHLPREPRRSLTSRTAITVPEISPSASRSGDTETSMSARDRHSQRRPCRGARPAPAARGQRLAHGIGERLAIALLHQVEDLEQRLAEGVRGRPTQQSCPALLTYTMCPSRSW